MNPRQALEALLSGKTIVRSDGDTLRLNLAGALIDAAGNERMLFLCGSALYEEPNPHEPGTYAWAREEHARGHDVTNDCCSNNIRAREPWASFMFRDREFETKTWRRA